LSFTSIFRRCEAPEPLSSLFNALPSVTAHGVGSLLPDEPIATVPGEMVVEPEQVPLLQLSDPVQPGEQVPPQPSEPHSCPAQLGVQQALL